MLWIDSKTKAALFRHCRIGDALWIGKVYEDPANGEAIPFQFGVHQYLMFFQSPLTAAGEDADLLRETANVWANGHQPCRASRLIKFCRADSEDDALFRPEQWELDHSHQIFQFAETLGEVVALHSEQCSSTAQYYYVAATDGLHKMYQRIFKRLNRTILRGRFFELQGLGETFYGYQKISG